MTALSVWWCYVVFCGMFPPCCIMMLCCITWLLCAQVLVYNRQCDDMEAWMDDVEQQLSSEDHGKDITTVTILLKKHQVSD